MYETIFSLANRPFLTAPRTDRYFPAAPVETARQTLVRGIERAEGPGLLIGPAGSGKSMICQLLAEQFADTYNIVLLSSTRLCTPRALLQNILFELELPFRDLEEGELRLNLIDFLQSGNTCPNAMLLLVDEANTLPLRLLEEIRMITNVVRDGVPRVRLVLAGGPQLEERFASPRLESLNQRIAARCYLQSMTREETAQYVLHQIHLADGKAESLFTEDALRAVFHATDGVPRLVNQICDHALMLAAAAGLTSLSAHGVEEAWADLQQLPAPSLTVDSNSGADALEAATIEFGQLDDELDAIIDHEIEFETDDELIGLAAETEPDSPEQASEIETAACQLDASPTDEVESAAKGTTTGAVDDSISSQSADPFAHEFEEEEVVLDRYASLDSFPNGACHQLNLVQEDESESVPAQHATAEMQSAEEWQPTIAGLASDDQPQHDLAEPEELPSADEDRLSDEVESQETEPTIHCIEEAAPAEGEMSDDDRDMIIIEEDVAHVENVAEPASGRVRRREYRHLFAKLRES